MRHFKHPATIIALIALFAAVSGGAGAAVSGLISGSQIQNNSIPENKLTSSAIKSLQVTGMSTQDSSSSCPDSNGNTSTFCGNPETVKFDKKTAVLVNGSIDMATTDGNENGASIGVCWAPHGSSSLHVVSHVFPEFAAAANSFFAEGVSGVVGGLKGKYDVGMCLKQETANTAMGHYAVTMLTAETNAGAKNISPS